MKRQAEARATYNPYDDGQATQRVIDIVFNDDTIPYNVGIGFLH